MSPSRSIAEESTVDANLYSIRARASASCTEDRGTPPDGEERGDGERSNGRVRRQERGKRREGGEMRGGTDQRERESGKGENEEERDG